MGYEGPAVYRVPCSNDAALENLENTVLEGIDLDRALEFTEDPPSTDGRVHLWGAKPTIRGAWSDIEPGDYLIFYRDGSYTYAAKVSGTEENEALARDIWPNFDGDLWSLIIYLDPPTEIDVPSAEIHELAGYEIDYTMKFSSLNEMGIGGIRGRYGSVEAFAEGQSPVGGCKDEPKPEDIDVHADPATDLDENVLDGLQFPDGRASELLEQVESALAAGKHVVFTGPPGTGKTELARRICDELVETNPGIYTGRQITTATADWSTFETVGGYMPTEQDDDGDLTFEPGQVLRRYKADGRQRNELLVVDEVNRADIDKAFGQLFTLLSGQAVQLPYRRDGEEIVVRPASEASGSPAPHEYVVPESWRIVATMNTYDKTSLYELSYAFMRRFSFVHVEAPTVPRPRDERVALLEGYAEAWGLDPDERTLDAVSELWHVLNREGSDRKIGPAIVEDVLRGVDHGPHRDRRSAITAAVANYVLPQLEGTPRAEAIVRDLADIDAVDGDRLADLAGDFLQVPIDA